MGDDHHDRALRLGALGANFNQSWDAINYADLKAARARWVRGFVTIVPTELDSGGPDGCPTDSLSPAQDAAVRVALDTVRRGYRVIFTLKFAYAAHPFPAPDTRELATVLRRVDTMLDLVLGTVDIIEIGNEPFLESRPEDRATALSAFYEAVTAHVVAFRAARYPSGCQTHLYLGALNRIDLPQNRTPATERWLDLARETPEIEGIDLHPHVPSPVDTEPFLAYALPRLRRDQSFLVTEFSLVWLWQKHVDDAAPAAFCADHGFASGTRVWEVIARAIESPLPQATWDAFTAQCAWFADQRHYLSQHMAMFRETGRLAVATYGFRQIASMAADWGPAKIPWLLNSVFAPITVARADGETSGRTRQWFEEFRALQDPER